MTCYGYTVERATHVCDPHLRERIINTAAQLLATEGAVSARRLARELGTSTIVVYTHFGGMDEPDR